MSLRSRLCVWLFTSALILTTAGTTCIVAQEPTRDDEPPRDNPRLISGIYPHLTTYGIYSENGAHTKRGHDECGIGAVVPWANKLWMVNYAPHMPRGSEHKLFSVGSDLELTIHPESVGGTPAGRMIHRESNQLLIAHYAIDAQGQVRAFPIDKMPIRVTAIARHLKDPANWVYFIDMEGSIWEANVHTLAVKQLFKKPVPGWHAKGGYTSQGRLVMSNNGELHVGTYADLLVGGEAESADEAGVLAEFDGEKWSIVERRQFTDVTGPRGIDGGGDDEPLWAIGWDRRSLRLKVLDAGQWSTYLLPKAAHCNDPRHGWYTEWPRIREITDGRWMMDMHGMFFDFPPTFSSRQTSGIRPIASHLRYVPDFCEWNGQLVLASDETSIQGNKLAGQPQSNLWFGHYQDLKYWGPASGYGGPWVRDSVRANTPSDPFLVAGFDHRVLHLTLHDAGEGASSWGARAADQQPLKQLPLALRSLTRVALPRGDWKAPAPGFSFSTNQPTTVFLAVDARGEPSLAPEWKITDMGIVWGSNHKDFVYRRDFDAGLIEIPGNTTEHIPGSFGMPHTAFVLTRADVAESLNVTADTPAKVILVKQPDVAAAAPASVRFRLETDRRGDGQWQLYREMSVGRGKLFTFPFPSDFDAQWLRITADQDCIATAYLHQTSSRKATLSRLFDGLADANDNTALGGLVYPSKKNRDLSVVTSGGDHYSFGKESFTFTEQPRDESLEELLEVEPEFTVDAASVLLTIQGKRLRLPKGHAAFDLPFGESWPRASREVQSERHLANIHGTFYEVPLLTNGAPPAFELMRPVSSHTKRITDFCSWNGLLVLAGVQESPSSNDHVFMDAKRNVGLWFGGVDDLWSLGKPVGRGGPWFETAVRANQPSDPYLMTGYDRKTLRLTTDRDTEVTIELDVDHQSGWYVYMTLPVVGNRTHTYEFPPGFSAHWLRLKSSSDCAITAELVYE